MAMALLTNDTQIEGFKSQMLWSYVSTGQVRELHNRSFSQPSEKLLSVYF